MKQSDFKNFIFVVLGVFFFRASLDLAYLYVISKAYGSVGFNYYPSSLSLLISYGATALGSLLMLQVRSGLSVKLTQFLFLITYFPSASYYGLTGYAGEVLIYGIVFWAIVFLMVWIIRPPHLPVVSNGDGLLIVICLFIGIGAIILSFLVFGIRLNFSFYGIYDFRAGRDITQIPFGGYIIPWAAKTAVPFLILYCWYALGRSGRSTLFLAIAAQLILYGSLGHKTYLFVAPAAMLLGWLAYKPRFTVLLPWLLAGGVAVSTAIDVATSDYTLSGILTRRIFFVPAQLTGFYFEYFSGNSIHLSHSIFSFLFDYPYTLPPPNMIGLAYFGLADQASNTGVLADGFMNFGVLGVIVWAMLLGVIFLVCESASKGKNARICYPMIILAVYTFSNGALLTTLLTHGLLLTIFLTMLMGRRETAALNSRGGFA